VLIADLDELAFAHEPATHILKNENIAGFLEFIAYANAEQSHMQFGSAGVARRHQGLERSRR
jgi:hypothetical protein